MTEDQLERDTLGWLQDVGNLRQNLSVDWSERESVRARLRLMVKRILRKYKYPPDSADAAVELVLQQAQKLGMEWAA